MNLTIRGLSICARPGQFAGLLFFVLLDGIRWHATQRNLPELLELADRHEARAEKEWREEAGNFIECIFENLRSLMESVKAKPEFSQACILPALDLAAEFVEGRLILNPPSEMADQR